MKLILIIIGLLLIGAGVIIALLVGFDDNIRWTLPRAIVLAAVCGGAILVGGYMVNQGSKPT